MKAIQEERMRGYFITAAKDLIRGEGLSVVSTRNVAERAGYSYATLYNYFKDIRDLIFSCVEDFMAECRDFVVQNTKEVTGGEEGLGAVSKEYAKFFVQYPGIFFLFYQHKQGAISTRNSDFSSIHALFDSLTERDWDEIKTKSGCSKGDIEQAREYHKLTIHGLLLFYLNRRKDMEYKELMDKVAELTGYAVKNAGKGKPSHARRTGGKSR